MYACSYSLRKRKFFPRSKLMADWNKPQPEGFLWKESANECGVRHAADGEDIRAGAHVRAMLPRRLVHFVKRAPHHYLELGVHFAFRPEETLQVLYPFEVTHRDASGIRQNIRNHHDALARQNFVRVRGGRAVGSFSNYFCLDLV